MIIPHVWESDNQQALLSQSKYQSKFCGPPPVEYTHSAHIGFLSGHHLILNLLAPGRCGDDFEKCSSNTRVVD